MGVFVAQGDKLLWAFCEYESISQHSVAHLFFPPQSTCDIKVTQVVQRLCRRSFIRKDGWSVETQGAFQSDCSKVMKLKQTFERIPNYLAGFSYLWICKM